MTDLIPVPRYAKLMEVFYDCGHAVIKVSHFSKICPECGHLSRYVYWQPVTW